MKSSFRVCVFLLLATVISAGTVFAVGYERVSLPDTPPAKVQNSMGSDLRGWEAVKKASFVEKIPGVIDDVAMLVKDVLGQFGLIEKKAP
jgi:hypothetical protein